MQITIASIELKETRSTVVTTEGRRLGVWTDKMGKMGLEQGGTYEVTTEAKDFNGRTLTNIVNAKRIEGVVAYPDRQPTPSNGAAFRTPAQMFVSEAIVAYIGAGKCANPAELKNAMANALAAWESIFGYEAAPHYGVAAE